MDVLQPLRNEFAALADKKGLSWHLYPAQPT